MAKNAARVDKPIAGLLTDLKRSGMLKDTLVVWATEFGRTPGAENSDGRDHHPYGFSVWMAGGGLKGGVVHGSTSKDGLDPDKDPAKIGDLFATIYKGLGIDPGSKVRDNLGRPLEIADGKPISALV